MPIRVSSKRKAQSPTPQAPQQASGLPFGLPQPPAGIAQKPPGISLCMIVKNEERFLGQALRSIADAVDEIIVVDTGSSDRTIEIAKSFGAKVIERAWRNDFSWARNASIEPATKRWIMFLDADEELTPESKPALEQLRSAPAYQSAVWVRCLNKSDDYRGTGDMSHALIRIFPNSDEIRFRGMIHEFPTIGDSPHGLAAVLSPVTIVHHGYLKEVVAERNKAQRNLDIVRAATDKEPEDPFHWFNLGTTAFMMGEYEQSRDALEEMLRLNGSTRRGFVPNGYAVLAEVYCDKLGDAVRGESTARRGLEVSPNYANAHFQLGKALVAQKRFDEARAAYQAAIDDGAYAHLQFVVDDQVYIWKAACEIGASYAAQGNDEMAVVWFRKAKEAVPKVEPVQLNLARALERIGRLDEAEPAYRDAFETHRDDMSTIDYVNFLLRRGRGLAALEAIVSVHADLSPKIAVAMLVAASQIAAKHQLPDVERYLQLAVERMPGNADALNPLETILRARGDEAAVASLLEREAATAAQGPADCLRRSYQAIAKQRFQEALALAAAGLQIAPGDAALRYNAAISLASMGRKEEALPQLRVIAADAGETYARAELLQAMILREFHRDEEALNSLERLLAAAPAHLDGLLARASLMESRGDGTGAERSLRAAFAVDPKRGGIELASLYMRTGRYEDAARIAEDALAP